MSFDDGLSDNMRNKIQSASEQANSLSKRFGFESNISVICKSDSQGYKKVQYIELCIKSTNNNPLPLLKSLWIEELTSKIQLLITALKDYKTDQFTTLQSILEHLQKKVSTYPGLSVIIPELEMAITTLERSFEYQEKKSFDIGSQAIH